MTADVSDPALPDPPAGDGPGLFGDPGPARAGPATPYRVLARAYRPTRFDDLIGQDAMVRILRRAFELGRVAHAFMLTGVRGVGKTTSARIIARALNCVGPDGTGGPTADPCGVCANCTAILADRHPDVLEMDAASRTGIDDVREIIEATRFRPMQARMKVFIVDEVHMLSKPAFNALLKTLEEPPSQVTFIFATTELRKVPVTVLSRCQRFDLRRVSIGELSARFASIAAREGAAISPDALALIARAADGSVRDGLSLLDQAIAQGPGQDGVGGREIGAAQVADMLGLADRGLVFDLLDAVMRGRADIALGITDQAHARGADLGQMLADLLELIHTVSRLKSIPALRDNAELPEAERVRGAALADALSVPVLGRAWQMLLKGVGEIDGAPDRREAAEMVLIRLCHVADLPTPGELVRQIQAEGPGAVAASVAPLASVAAASGAVRSAGPGASVGASALSAALSAGPATGPAPTGGSDAPAVAIAADDTGAEAGRSAGPDRQPSELVAAGSPDVSAPPTGPIATASDPARPGATSAAAIEQHAGASGGPAPVPERGPSDAPDRAAAAAGVAPHDDTLAAARPASPSAGPAMPGASVALEPAAPAGPVAAAVPSPLDASRRGDPSGADVAHATVPPPPGEPPAAFAGAPEPAVPAGPVAAAVPSPLDVSRRSDPSGVAVPVAHATVPPPPAEPPAAFAGAPEPAVPAGPVAAAMPSPLDASRRGDPSGAPVADTTAPPAVFAGALEPAAPAGPDGQRATAIASAGSASSLLAVPVLSGGGAMRAAEHEADPSMAIAPGVASGVAPGVAPDVGPEIAPAAAPLPVLRSWREVVAFVNARRLVRLHGNLMHCAHLVRFRPPVIELALEPGAPRELSQQLAAVLLEATGTRWSIVVLRDEPGEPTLAQQAGLVQADLDRDAESHPLVQAILAAFPGAVVGPVSDRSLDEYYALPPEQDAALLAEDATPEAPPDMEFAPDGAESVGLEDLADAFGRG